MRENYRKFAFAHTLARTSVWKIHHDKVNIHTHENINCCRYGLTNTNTNKLLNYFENDNQQTEMNENKILSGFIELNICVRARRARERERKFSINPGQKAGKNPVICCCSFFSLSPLHLSLSLRFNSRISKFWNFVFRVLWWLTAGLKPKNFPNGWCVSSRLNRQSQSDD